MAKVYRVEYEDGAGPYRNRGRIDSPHANGCSEWHRHPAPWHDGICSGWGLVPPDLAFGFASKRQLQAWFRVADRRHLASKGFKLAVYQVDKRDVVRGGKQIAFRKAKATLVERQPIA